MEGVGDVLQWATGTLEGVAFVEYLILGAVYLLYRQVKGLGRRLDVHEKEEAARHNATQERLAEGSTKMAVHDRRLDELQDDIREIKHAVQRE